MHSMQAGYLEKAQKYTDKALMQLEKLKSEWVYFFFHFLRNVLLEIYFHPKRICGKSSTFWSLCCSVGLQSHPLYLPSHSTGAYYHVPACHWPQGYRFARGKAESHAMVIHTSSYLINICWLNLPAVPSPHTLTRCLLPSDLAGVPAVPAVPQAVH